MEKYFTRFVHICVWLFIIIIISSCAQNVAYREENSDSGSILFKRTYRDPISRTDQSRLKGFLKKPKGEGPFPAVVMLIDTELRVPGDREWEERLVSWGYVVLHVDSMGSRGIALYDYGPGHHFNLYWQQHIARAHDALDAKKYLAGLPFVNPKKIAVIGWSYGGKALFHGVLENNDPFQAAVVFYDDYVYTEVQSSNTPLMMMTFKYLEKAYRKRMAALEQNTHEVQFNFYRVAYPGFDLAGERWLKFFHNIAAEYYFGVQFKYNREAADDSVVKVKNFLAKHLQRS